MLTKMRRQVVLTAMLSIFIVMFLLVALINIVNYTILERQTDQTLAHIFDVESSPSAPETDGSAPPQEFQKTPIRDYDDTTIFFVAHLDADKTVTEITSVSASSLDREAAEQLAEEASSGQKTDGYLQPYRYRISTTDDETLIVFLNVSKDVSFMKTLLRLSLLVVAASLLLAFLLVLLLSKKAVRPFVQNYEQQKRFITDASHELKTPLTSISTSLDVLDNEGEQNEWLSNIRQQTDHMSEMVRDLVMLSRLDEANPFPQTEMFSLSEAAWEIAEGFQYRTRAEGKQFETEIAEHVRLQGDSSSIRTMLSTLLDNAVRYSDEGGTIRLTIEEIKGRACVDVFNTCAFQLPVDLDRLFDRFYRPDEFRSASTGGTGIGLSIVKSVAEAHGGEVSASCPDDRSLHICVIL